MKTLTAFLDLTYCPVSFDFVTWLVHAMLQRDQRRCDRLHVVIVPNEEPESLGGFSRHWGNHDEAATRWRLWHICVASCPLARATVTVAADRRQAERMKNGESWWPEGKPHFMFPMVDAARRGDPVPKLQATEAARRYVEKFLNGRRVVTLTVRHQSTVPDNNSNIEAWQAFAKWLLDERKISPMWVNEANDSLANGHGWAELDPDIRMALYEQAAMNVIGKNGPSVLMHCSDVPYLNFGIGLNAGDREHYKNYFHLEHGEQLPWARPDQRMVFKADTFENLKEEFDRWESSATRLA